MEVRQAVKTVSLKLDYNENAFSLFSEFQTRAKKEGWKDEEINAVISDAMSDDHEHLVQVLKKHCK